MFSKNKKVGFWNACPGSSVESGFGNQPREPAHAASPRAQIPVGWPGWRVGWVGKIYSQNNQVQIKV